MDNISDNYNCKNSTVVEYMFVKRPLEESWATRCKWLAAQGAHGFKLCQMYTDIEYFHGEEFLCMRFILSRERQTQCQNIEP